MKNSSLFRSFLLSKSVATHNAASNISKSENSQKEIRRTGIYPPPHSPPHHHHQHLYLTWRRGRWAPPPSGRSSSPSRAPCGQTQWKIISLSKTNSDHSDQASLLACLPPRKSHTCYTAIHYTGPTGPWAFKLILKPNQHHFIDWLMYNDCRAPPGQHNPLLAEFASDPGNICLKLCWVFASFAHTPEVPEL